MVEGKHHFLPSWILRKKLTSQENSIIIHTLISTGFNSLKPCGLGQQSSCPLYSRDFLLTCSTQSQRIPSVWRTEHSPKSRIVRAAAGVTLTASPDCSLQGSCGWLQTPAPCAALYTQSSLQLPRWLLGWYQAPNLNLLLKTSGNNGRLTAWRSPRTVTALSRIFLYWCSLWTWRLL